MGETNPFTIAEGSEEWAGDDSEGRGFPLDVAEVVDRPGMVLTGEEDEEDRPAMVLTGEEDEEDRPAMVLTGEEDEDDLTDLKGKVYMLAVHLGDSG
jgi:hypothetical protein